MTDPADRTLTEPSAVTSGEPAAFDPSRPAAIAEPEPGPERPLPPLPDGGLGASMPDWLRAVPARDSPIGTDAVGSGPPSAGANPDPDAPELPAPEVIDPTTFITEDDLPEWIRRLAAAEPRPAPDVAWPRADQRTAAPLGSEGNLASSLDERARTAPSELAPDTRSSAHAGVPSRGGVEEGEPSAKVRRSIDVAVTESDSAPGDVLPTGSSVRDIPPPIPPSDLAVTPVPAPDLDAPMEARRRVGPWLDRVPIVLGLVLVLLAVLAVLAAAGALP